MDTLRPSEINNMIEDLDRRLTNVGLCLSGTIDSATWEIAKGIPFTYSPITDADADMISDFVPKSKIIADWLIDHVNENLMLRFFDLCKHYRLIDSQLNEIIQLFMVEFTDAPFFKFWTILLESENAIGNAIACMYPQFVNKWNDRLKPAGNEQQSHAVEAAQDIEAPQAPDGEQLIAEVPQAPDADLSYITLGGKRIELGKSLRKPIVHSMLKKAYDFGDIGVREYKPGIWKLVNQFEQKNQLPFFAKVICIKAYAKNADWKRLFPDNDSFDDLYNKMSENGDEAKSNWLLIQRKDESLQEEYINNLPNKPIRWMVQMLKKYSKL